MNEQTTITSLDINSPLEKFQGYLVQQTRTALNQPTFELRNTMMAKAVGLEASLLTARAVGNPMAASALQEVFTQACLEAGLEFHEAFDEQGNPILDNTSIFEKAQSDGAVFALKNLSAALEACGIKEEPDYVLELLREVNFFQVMKNTAEALNPTMTDHRILMDFETIRREKKPVDVIKALHSMVQKGNHLEEEIDYIPNATEVDYSLKNQQIIEIAVRLANATWKSNTLEVAIWKNQMDRINPNERNGVFNPYDLLKEQQYKSFSKQFSDIDGLLRISLEVWKDILELRKAMEKVPSPQS